MHEIITGSLAGAVDRYTIGTLSVPSLRLMERAAHAVYRHAKAALLKHSDTVYLFCGTGNNGADGLAAGAMLQKDGYREVYAFCCGNPARESREFQIQKERFLRAGGRFYPFSDYEAAAGGRVPALLIDAVFGIGLHRAVGGDFLSAIEEMNLLRNAGSYVISVDIPSGIDADSGKNMCAPLYPVHADETVTFGYAKTGHYLDYGYGNCGKIFVCDIGYPEDVLSRVDSEGALYDTREAFLEAQETFSHRDPRSNKGSYRKLLIIAGAKGMAGAAYFSGLAAYRCGTGMVKYFGPEENRQILQGLLPEAMYESVSAEFDGTGAEAWENVKKQLSESLAWADLVVLGPGLSKTPEAGKLTEETLRLLHERSRGKEAGAKPVRAVLDADALNLVAENRALLQYLTEDMVLTPHIGELARLTEQCTEDVKDKLMETAVRFAKTWHTNVVAKDCVSLVAEADGSCWINLSGSPSMAKAGSGDVLTGVIAGCTAIMGPEHFRSAIPAAVFLHGKAGEYSAKAGGVHAMLARELADALPQAMRCL